MADMGLAALSGIMRGLGGFPEGLQAGEEARMRREQMEEANRARMAQEQFQQAQLAQTLGLQKETLGLRREELAEQARFHAESLGAPERAATRERERLGELGRILQLPTMPGPERAEQELTTPPRPEQALLGQILATGGAKPEGAAALMKVISPAPPKSPTATEEVHAARKRVAAAWAAGTEADPEDENLVNLAAAPTMVAPGGKAAPRTKALLGEPPQTPPGPGPKPTPGYARPSAVEPTIMTELADISTTLSLGQDVLRRWDTDWPGFRARAGFAEIPGPGGARLSSVVGGKMTPAQEQIYADAAHVIGPIRRALTGLAQTDPEARRMVGGLPNNPAALSKAQLQGAVTYLARRHAEIRRGLVETGRRPGPTAPAPVAPTAPGAGTQTLRVRDRKTGRTGTLTLRPGETIPPTLEVIP